MSELSATHEISPFMAILWVFYPIGILIFFELLMGSQDDDDDDQAWKCQRGITMLKGQRYVKSLNIPRQRDVKLNELPNFYAASLALFSHS